MTRPVLLLLALLLSMTTLAPPAVGLAGQAADPVDQVSASHDDRHGGGDTRHGHRHNHSGCSLAMAAVPCEPIRVTASSHAYRASVGTDALQMPFLKPDQRPPIA